MIYLRFIREDSEGVVSDGPTIGPFDEIGIGTTCIFRPSSGGLIAGLTDNDSWWILKHRAPEFDLGDHPLGPYSEIQVIEDCEPDERCRSETCSHHGQAHLIGECTETCDQCGEPTDDIVGHRTMAHSRP